MELRAATLAQGGTWNLNAYIIDRLAELVSDPENQRAVAEYRAQVSDRAEASPEPRAAPRKKAAAKGQGRASTKSTRRPRA